MHRTTGDGYTIIGGKRYFIDQALPGETGTIVEQYIMNSIQEEIAAVVEGAGLTLASDGPTDTRNQMYTAIFNNVALSATALATDAVTNPKIENGAVTTNKIGIEQVTESRIADSAATESKIAAGAVTTTKIPTGNIVRDHAQRESTVTLTGWTPYRVIRNTQTVPSNTIGVVIPNVSSSGSEISRVTGSWNWGTGGDYAYAPVNMVDWVFVGGGANLTLSFASLDSSGSSHLPAPGTNVTLKLYIEYHPDEPN